MMTGIVAACIIIGLFFLNVWLYRTNKKTPVPEGCENLTPDCHSCGIKDCSSRMGKEDNDGNY